MKRIHITLAAALIAATGAYAQAPPSRADVKAETRAANARGELPVGEHEDVTPKKRPPTHTRAEQREETRKLGAQGKLPVGESYSPDVSSSKKSGTDRRSVRSEAAAANKEGTLMKPGN
jgi:hypothetical protein